MWLNQKLTSDTAIKTYRKSLKCTCPKHVVIEGLFNHIRLDQVIQILQQPHNWQTQKHTYSALYVDDNKWLEADKEERFVQRDLWQRPDNCFSADNNIAQQFLSYLRSEDFLSVLSAIFNVKLTDINVANPPINTNYFRLSPNDFVSEHADDSPGREVCLLLYLNPNWKENTGGELVFSGKNNQSIYIPPLHNRCVLFDPASEGSEHWVNQVTSKFGDNYRYNVTSWYWRE